MEREIVLQGFFFFTPPYYLYTENFLNIENTIT